MIVHYICKAMGLHQGMLHLRMLRLACWHDLVAYPDILTGTAQLHGEGGHACAGMSGSMALLQWQPSSGKAAQ